MAAAGFLMLMGFQLIQSIRIDSYELTQTRFDLVGYWLILGISVLLGLKLLRHKKLLIIPTYFTLVLILYIVLVRLFTLPSESTISFLISRYGIFFWFVIGIGAAAILDIFRENHPTSRSKSEVFLISIVLTGVALIILDFALRYLSFPVQTRSYQSVASSAAILIIYTIFVIDAFWGNRKPLLVSVLYFLVGTILVAAVARLQSTSMVALWVFIVVLFFGRTLQESRLLTKAFLIVSFVTLFWFFLQTEVFEDLTKQTRFAVFFGTGGEFSPLATRLSLLNDFYDQFAVSPVFGNFQAEIIAGSGRGYYVHSVPLSFLTHTGIVGTTLFALILTLLFASRSRSWRQVDRSEQNVGLTLIGLFGLGTIAAFLTWPPLWFMLGMLCKKPKKQLERR